MCDGSPVFKVSTDLKEKLFAAVRQGNVKELKELLNNDNLSDLDCIKDENGDALLISAVKEGHEAIVRLLLERGADVNAPIGALGIQELLLHYPNTIRLLRWSGADIPRPNNNVMERFVLYTALRKVPHIFKWLKDPTKSFPKLTSIEEFMFILPPQAFLDIGEWIYCFGINTYKSTITLKKEEFKYELDARKQLLDRFNPLLGAAGK